MNALGTAIWAYGIAPLLHALFCCRGRAIFSHLFAFCGIPACCRRASSDSYSTIIPPPCRKHRKHSTVPHSAVNPRNKQQSKYAPITARQRRHADGVGSRQHVVEHIYRSLCPQSERINRHMLGLRKHCWWCDARRVCLYTVLFSPSFLFLPYMRRPGCFGGPWSAWHLQLTTYEVCTENCGPLCAIQSFAFGSIVLVSERSGRQKPPAERSALDSRILRST